MTHKDVFCITYADTIKKEDQVPLKTLQSFLQKYAKDFSSIHILPPFPFSSDDGFSITDYENIRPDLGTWKDITKISKSHKVMLDGVINHTSSKHPWVKQNPEYYLQYSKENLLKPKEQKKIIRPRTTNLLTEKGGKFFWSTFSKDQFDLNFQNPKLKKEIINILKQYKKYGTSYIRLDAIGYIVKKRGTKCVNLPETINLIKEINQKLPGTKLIAEINMPYPEIKKYQKKEICDAVYNFPLPPLIYYTFTTNDPKPLIKYLKKSDNKKQTNIFLNFLASHDGIGLTPTKGYLTKKQQEKIIKDTKDKGFQVSLKSQKGKEVPYECNINFKDALPSNQHFLAAHAILISLKGIPAIYIHSLIGSKGTKNKTRHPRKTNRASINIKTLEKALKDLKNERSHIYTEMCKLLQIRKSTPAFHPTAKQDIKQIKKNTLQITRTHKTKVYTYTATTTVNIETGEYKIEQTKKKQ